MSNTGSIPANSPSWSAPDSIGYAIWNRLTGYGASPIGAGITLSGITLSGNTSAIYDRHMSFLDSLTAQQARAAAPTARGRAYDVRVFRHTVTPGVAGGRGHRPGREGFANAAPRQRGQAVVRGYRMWPSSTPILDGDTPLDRDTPQIGRTPGRTVPATAVPTAARSDRSTSMAKWSPTTMPQRRVVGTDVPGQSGGERYGGDVPGLVVDSTIPARSTTMGQNGVRQSVRFVGVPDPRFATLASAEAGISLTSPGPTIARPARATTILASSPSSPLQSPPTWTPLLTPPEPGDGRFELAPFRTAQGDLRVAQTNGALSRRRVGLLPAPPAGYALLAMPQMVLRTGAAGREPSEFATIARLVGPPSAPKDAAVDWPAGKPLTSNVGSAEATVAAPSTSLAPDSPADGSSLSLLPERRAGRAAGGGLGLAHWDVRVAHATAAFSTPAADMVVGMSPVRPSPWQPGPVVGLSAEHPSALPPRWHSPWGQSVDLPVRVSAASWPWQSRSQPLVDSTVRLSVSWPRQALTDDRPGARRSEPAGREVPLGPQPVVDLAVGLSPGMPARLVVLGTRTTAVRAGAADVEALRLPTRTYMDVQPRRTEDPAAAGHDEPWPVVAADAAAARDAGAAEDSGMARAPVPAPVASLSLQSIAASVGPPPLPKVDQRAPFGRGALGVAAPDIRIASVEMAQSGLSANGTVGSWPAVTGRSVMPGIQLTASAEAGGVAFSPADLVHPKPAALEPKLLAAGSDNVSISARLPSTGGFSGAPGLFRLSVDRSPMLAATAFPILLKGALQGNIGHAEMVRMSNTPKGLPIGFTSATDRRGAGSPAISRLSGATVIGVDEPMPSTPTSLRSLRPFAREPSLPDVAGGQMRSGSVIFRGQLDGSIFSDPPASRTTDEGDLPAAALDTFSMASPRTNLPLSIAPRDPTVATHSGVSGTAGAETSVVMPLAIAPRRAVAIHSGGSGAERSVAMPLSVAPSDRGVAVQSGGSGAGGAETSVAMPLSIAPRRAVAIHSGGFGGGAQKSAAMPLVVARAAAPGPAFSGGSNSAPVSGPETSAAAGSEPGVPKRGSSHDAEADADEIVERAWGALMARLAIEQERRGFRRWA
jgi:hypothetical protein